MTGFRAHEGTQPARGQGLDKPTGARQGLAGDLISGCRESGASPYTLIPHGDPLTSTFVVRADLGMYGAGRVAGAGELGFWLWGLDNAWWGGVFVVG